MTETATSKTGRIYTMHGIVRNIDAELFVHRNMNDTDTFITHLKNRQHSYVSLAEAIRGNGDALTVDDSTYAAVDVVRTAREHGHEVTYFINPWHIETGVAYMPALLNVLMDAVHSEEILFRGHSYACRTLEQRKVFRGMARYFLETVSNDDQAMYLESCARENKVTLQVPRHLQSVTKQEVTELQSLGAHISNHGWHHTAHRVLSAHEKLENIQRGALWLENELNISTNHYAVPFGAEDDLVSVPQESNWYLLDAKRPEGLTPEGFINRSLYTD